MKPKLLREQMIECDKAGFRYESEFVSFENHPERLPAFLYIDKPLEKMREAIESGELKGYYQTICGRFGGHCTTKNEQCRKLRGLE